MNRQYLALASRIEDEIEDLERIVARTEKAWKRVGVSKLDLK